MKKTKFEAVIDLAREFGVDESGLRKTITRLGFKAEQVRRKSDKRIVLVVSEKDADLLRAKCKLKNVGKSDVPLAQAASDLHMDKSYCQKQCGKLGVTLHKKRQDGGRVVNVMTKSGFEKLKDSRTHIEELAVIDL